MTVALLRLGGEGEVSWGADRFLWAWGLGMARSVLQYYLERPGVAANKSPSSWLTLTAGLADSTAVSAILATEQF